MVRRSRIVKLELPKDTPINQCSKSFVLLKVLRFLPQVLSGFGEGEHVEKM